MAIDVTHPPYDVERYGAEQEYSGTARRTATVSIAPTGVKLTTLESTIEEAVKTITRLQQENAKLQEEIKALKEHYKQRDEELSHRLVSAQLNTAVRVER